MCGSGFEADSVRTLIWYHGFRFLQFADNGKIVCTLSAKFLFESPFVLAGNKITHYFSDEVEIRQDGTIDCGVKGPSKS